jgi:histidinol-phosphate aminotransferase
MPSVRPEIVNMKGYVPGEQPRGREKFIKLNTNENPYPCSPAVGRAIAAVIERGLQKYPDPMAEGFRLRAAAVLGVEPNWILCGNGSDDILTIVTRAFVGQSDCLRLPYPSYILYKTLAKLQGAEAEEIRFQADWSLGDDFSAPRSRLKLVFLPNPNSPSGTVIPPERILQLAERLPCPLLVDEAYVDFAETNCVRLVAQSEKIMVSRTLSKSYALAGLRFGFLIAQPQVIEQLVKVKDSYNCDSLSIAGATAAIDDQAWLADNRQKIIAARAKLTDGMRSLGFAAVESQANFIWCPYPTTPVRPLYEQLKAEHILVRYMDYAGWGDGLRISVGTPEQVDACLGALERMIAR